MAKLVLDGTSYTLRLDFNAICAFEKASGKGFISFQNNLAEKGALAMEISDLRALLWAGLLCERDLTLEQAGNLMTGDNINDIMTAISGAIQESFPSAPAGDTDKKKTKSPN